MNRLQKLELLIQEIDSFRSEPAWGAKYKVWSQRAESLLEKEFGAKALALFLQQQSVALIDDAFFEELNERKTLLEEIIRHENDYVPSKPNRIGLILARIRLKGSDINWTKWGTIVGCFALAVAALAWLFPKG